MRFPVIAALLLATLPGVSHAVADPVADPNHLQVSLEVADGSVYQKHDLNIRLTFRNTAEPRVRIPAEAFQAGAFSLQDARGNIVVPADAESLQRVEALDLDGYGTVERVIDLSPWYPRLTSKRREWTLTWNWGEWSAAPLTIKVIRPHNPEKDRYAILETDMGRMRWELLTKEAPRHVKRFVDLVREGYYDGRSFYRVVPGVIVEAGNPNDDGTGGWDRLMMPEIVDDLEMTMGLVGAQRREGSSMTSNRVFFITLSSTRYMAGKQTFFARVVDGMGLVARLNVAENRGNNGLKNAFMLVNPVMIRSARIK